MVQGRPSRQTRRVDIRQGSRAKTQRPYPRIDARHLQQPRGLGGHPNSHANWQSLARTPGHGPATVPATHHSNCFPPGSPRRHRLRPRSVQHARRQTVGLTTVHHLPSTDTKATPATSGEEHGVTSGEEQRQEMLSLRAQAWVPTYMWCMRPVVLSDLHIKTPVQGQHRWRRTELGQNLRPTIRPIDKDDHGRTNGVEKAIYLELLPKKARNPCRAPSETASIVEKARSLAASFNHSWLKDASPLPSIAEPEFEHDPARRHAVRTQPLSRPTPCQAPRRRLR